MRTRLRAPIALSILASAALLAAGGCGGSDSGGGATSPASVAPVDTPFYVEAVVRPEGELKTNIESFSKNLAGISDPGALIVDQLDSSLAEDNSNISYETDIEPWLGESAGLFLTDFGGSDFGGAGAAVQTTDSSAASDFVDKLAQTSDSPVKQGSYEGVDYTTDSSDGTTVGVVDDLLVLGQDQRAFEKAVDASGGDSLEDNDLYTETIADAPGGSLADLYVNVGDLIRSAGASVDQQVLQFYKSVGVDFSDATALASVVPGADSIEIESSTDAGGEISSGDVTEFLGSFPAASWAAFATPDVGEQIKTVVDGLDKNGIPGSVPPGQLKSALSSQGINIDSIASSIGDVGVFVEGTDSAGLGGAIVMEAKDPKAASDTVSQIGGLVDLSGTSGYKKIDGGFSVRDPGQLGVQPVEVVAKGDRIVVGYGSKATQQALGSGSTLKGSAAFDDAEQSLEGTNLNGFVDIATVLDLVESMGLSSDPDYAQVKRYLDKLDFAAIGTGSSGGRATSKVVVQLEK